LSDGGTARPTDMTSRRALVLALAIGAFVVSWAASRYALQVGGVRADAHPAAAAAAPAAADAAAGGEAMTLRFFRNPAAAPSFTARDLDGREISSASLRGKVVLINFWATWCPPCRAEIPDLIALQDKYRDQLQVIGISEDESGPDVVRRFVADHRMNYPVVMTSPEIEKLFPGIGALPTSFVVDRQARLVQKHVGMLTARTTEYETRHLAGLPVNATIEEVDQTQGLKLENGAQLMTIPGVDLTKLSPAKRADALQKLNSQPCTCGCDLTVAKCRVDDPNCGVSLPLARQIVAQIASSPQ
jgi:thiol-disulfide isomerase/thioredoxin